MCSDEQHAEKMGVLNRIHSHMKALHDHVMKTPDDATILISATQPWVIDYRGFKHIFVYPLNSASLLLTLEDAGTFPLTPNEWNNVSFPFGMKVFAKGQVNPTPLIIRCTDEVIP